MEYSISQIKEEALEKLQGNWGSLVLSVLVFTILTTIAGIIPFGGLIIGGPLTYGLNILFLNFTRNGNKETNQLFDGFKDFGNALGAYLLMAIVIVFFFILLIVPGIIAALALSQTYRLMKDEGLDCVEAMKKSRDIMRGHKADYFLLNLSFIGWAILCIFTIGIGFFFLTPYVFTANTIFYNKINGAPDELEGFAEHLIK
jgi:uncharacterized membrane protein